MAVLRLLHLFAATSVVASATAPFAREARANTQFIEARHVNGSISAVETTSTTAPFDGPKVVPVNEKTFDWWYFDAVSKDASQSLTVAFYSATKAGLGYGPNGTAVFVHVSGNFPNGTMFSTALPAANRVLSTTGNGSSGSWNGTGFKWHGTPDLREYTMEARDIQGFSGKMKLRSVAPAHYPCGPAISGQSEEVVPGIGWANAIPDADAEVEFRIGDYNMSFSGYGYHDKNWGSRPFPESVGSWYWGHARLGFYSIVWFDTLTPNRTESVSAYVVKDGQVLARQCSKMSVRPTGDNATYPPILTTGPPSGFHLELDMGSEGLLIADMDNSVLATTMGTGYERFTGNVTGTLNGIALAPGSGLWVQADGELGLKVSPRKGARQTPGVTPGMRIGWMCYLGEVF